MSNKQQKVVFKNFSKDEIRIANSFVGKKRMTLLNYNENNFIVAFVQPFMRFQQKMHFVFNLSEEEVFVSVNKPISMVQFDKRFDEIDLALVTDDTLRTHLASCSISGLLDNLSVAIGKQISLQNIEYTTKKKPGQCSIGIGLFNITTGDIFYGNISTNKEVFEKLLNAIEKIEPLEKNDYDDLLTSFHIELGKTELSKEEYFNMGLNHIIFLDEKQNLEQQQYKLNGLSPLEVSCKYTNNQLLVTSVK